MKYAQAIPGVVDGRGIGIIDSRLLIAVVDSVELIRATLTQQQYMSIVQWFSEFNKWLLTSENGFEEEKAHNNHGTWFDAQVVAFAIFTEEFAIARERLQVTQMRRIGYQFDINGLQSAELTRTRPFHYSNFNLEAFSLLAHYGDVVGVDLWNHEMEQRSLKRGYTFIAMAVLTPNDWKYREVKGFDASIAYCNLLYAKKAYNGMIFSQALAALKYNKKAQKHLCNLLFLKE